MQPIWRLHPDHDGAFALGRVPPQSSLYLVGPVRVQGHGGNGNQLFKTFLNVI